ncbi:hypothetical protein CL618_01210 [archaeon]|nr:hypothetical protein [archaeon]|tara:strand:- start:736 stop:1389 length:654 start_codon:yes stop_codon:yes gene_type:complete
MKEAIEQPTQEQIQRAIQTVPFPVHFFSADMYAHDLRFPDTHRLEDTYEQDIETYLSQCADLGILPFSQVILDYETNHTREKARFATRSERLITTGFHHPDHVNETTNQSLIRGGKPNRIMVSIKPIIMIKGAGRIGFQAFKEQLLETLLEEEYAFDSARVEFDLKEESPTHQSYVSINEYNCSGKERLMMITYDSESPKNKQKFLDWFDQLQQVPV